MGDGYKLSAWFSKLLTRDDRGVFLISFEFMPGSINLSFPFVSFWSYGINKGSLRREFTASCLFGLKSTLFKLSSLSISYLKEILFLDWFLNLMVSLAMWSIEEVNFVFWMVMDFCYCLNYYYNFDIYYDG